MSVFRIRTALIGAAATVELDCPVMLPLLAYKVLAYHIPGCGGNTPGGHANMGIGGPRMEY